MEIAGIAHLTSLMFRFALQIQQAFEAYPGFWGLLAFFFGMCLASFGGVVAHRLPLMIAAGEGSVSGPVPATLGGRSHCDSCGEIISPIALFPILGWVLSRGRCSACGSEISPLYPIVEAFTAVLFAGIALFFGPTFEAVAAMGVLWTCIVLSWMDLEHFLLPDQVTIPLILVGLAVSPFETDPMARILGLVFGLSFVWCIFYAFSKVRHVDAMSLGDVALVGAAGAWLGYSVLPILLMQTSGLFIAFVLLSRRSNNDWFPMGPAICAAMMISILFPVKVF